MCVAQSARQWAHAEPEQCSVTSCDTQTTSNYTTNIGVQFEFTTKLLLHHTNTVSTIYIWAVFHLITVKFTEFQYKKEHRDCTASKINNGKNVLPMRKKWCRGNLNSRDTYGLWVGEWSQSVVILLTRRIPQAQVDWFTINHHICRVVIKPKCATNNSDLYDCRNIIFVLTAALLKLILPFDR